MPSSSQDPVLEALLLKLDQSEGSALWFAEEQNPSQALSRILVKREATYISNRIDQVDGMLAVGVRAEFHDFEAVRLGERRFEHVFLRVPKQRALVHHLLNLTTDLLVEGGTLWLAGLKGEGIKTHVQRAESRLGCRAKKIRSDGGGVGLYLLEAGFPGPPLDDDNYAEMRELQIEPGLSLWSKPGIYGWNKADRGSVLLVEILRKLYPNLDGKTVLDLGCGYGYLAIQAANLNPGRILATDNNAAAVQAATANRAAREFPVQVLASDCGSLIKEKFDLVLCNPPFHQGFAVTQDLHQKFLAAIARVLAPEGRALVVVNSFLRLDNLAEKNELQILQSWQFDLDQFRVICLSRRGERGAKGV